MDHWDITGLIDFSICGDEVIEGKPSPEALMELCNRAGVVPNVIVWLLEIPVVILLWDLDQELAL